VTILNLATNISLEFFHFILNPEQRRVFQVVGNITTSAAQAVFAKKPMVVVPIQALKICSIKNMCDIDFQSSAVEIAIVCHLDVVTSKVSHCTFVITSLLVYKFVSLLFAFYL
jgi:hypothetical protein